MVVSFSLSNSEFICLFCVLLFALPQPEITTSYLWVLSCSLSDASHCKLGFPSLGNNLRALERAGSQAFLAHHFNILSTPSPASSSNTSKARSNPTKKRFLEI
eukprot:4415287-Amphidinium_carterae.1